MMNAFHTACSCLHKNIRILLANLPTEIKANATEIVLRKNDSLYVICKNKMVYITTDAQCSNHPACSYKVKEEELAQSVLRACGFSLYAHKDELVRGFVSIGNGCRMALVGHFGCVQDVFSDLSVIQAIKIRIARDIYLDTSFVISDTGIASSLIVGPPSSGKTTMLRSIARSLADCNNASVCSVSVVDERGEIFPASIQRPSCVDVISGIGKAEGINMAVRLFSPQVVICDEIGTASEAQVIKDCLNCGVVFICSMHAGSEEELFRRACYRSLANACVFEKIVFMKDAGSPGEVRRIKACKEICFA